MRPEGEPAGKVVDMATTLTKLLTADDLLRLDSEGVRGELIRGVLYETMPTGQEHGEIAANLVTELRNFVKPRKLGRLTVSDAGVWLERDPDTVREPDIAYTSAARLPPGVRVRGYAEVVPDLVVEIVSPAMAGVKSATRRGCGCFTACAWCGSCSQTCTRWTCMSRTGRS